MVAMLACVYVMFIYNGLSDVSESIVAQNMCTFPPQVEKKGLVAIVRGRAHPKLTSRELSRGEYGSVQKPPS